MSGSHESKSPAHSEEGSEVTQGRVASQNGNPSRLPRSSDTTHGSQVEWYGFEVSHCGYCKCDQTEGRRSYDMKAVKLLAEDYQVLLDRGWRRSGHFCYHTINHSTCCPNYPISCKALEFQLSKSQRLCIEYLNSFLISGQRSRINLNYSKQETAATIGDFKPFDVLKSSSKARARRFVLSCERKMQLHHLSLEEAIKMVRERARIKHCRQHAHGSLENYLYPKSTSAPESMRPLRAKHCLEIKMLHVESAESKAMRREEHELLKKYQAKIHKDSPKEWNMSRYCDFLVDSPIIVEPIQDRDYLLSPNCDSDTRVAKVNDTNSDDSFLVEPPDLPTSLGTYHCVYYLDGKLIAVGVLDVLTKCISTVYFFYDPAYGYLNLGIYSALVEISMIRRMSKHYTGPAERNRLIYYYLGLYVHECKKMRYKTRFRPSYLLCSETWQHIPTELCLRKLEGRKYAKFSSSISPVNVYSLEDIIKIPVITPITTSMGMYLAWIEGNLATDCLNILIDNVIVRYCRVIGHDLLPKLTLNLGAYHRALVEKHRESKES